MKSEEYMPDYSIASIDDRDTWLSHILDEMIANADGILQTEDVKAKAEEIVRRIREEAREG